MTSGARAGLVVAIVTQVIWGFLPLWAGLYAHTPALLMMFHRILFCVLTAFAALIFTKEINGFVALLQTPRRWMPLLVSAALLAVNWLTFFVTIQANHILEVSLATYIMPLCGIALGALVLREPLNRLNAVGLVAAAIGVFVMSMDAAGPPWFGLIIAGSFACYTLFRKLYRIKPILGIAFETMAMLPFALLIPLFTENFGAIIFGDSPAHLAWLISFGPQTALTMLMFTFATQHLRLSTTGILQFLSPSIIFATALVRGDAISAARGLGFVLIWIGVGLYILNAILQRPGRSVPAAVPPI